LGGSRCANEDRPCLHFAAALHCAALGRHGNLCLPSFVVLLPTSAIYGKDPPAQVIVWPESGTAVLRLSIPRRRVRHVSTFVSDRANLPELAESEGEGNSQRQFFSVPVRQAQSTDWRWGDDSAQCGRGTGGEMTARTETDFPTHSHTFPRLVDRTVSPYTRFERTFELAAGFFGEHGEPYRYNSSIGTATSRGACSRHAV
jgi:hypothetical protein